MGNLTAEQIAERVREYDLDPPAPDYNPEEFGREIAQMFNGNAADVARICLETLPGSRAESFLDGFLATAAGDPLDCVLISCIPRAYDVGSGASIVRLVQRFGDVTNNEIANGILDYLALTDAPPMQDRLCYALWSLIRGGAYDVESGRVVTNSGPFPLSRIKALCNTHHLTEYGASSLKKCLEQFP